MDDPDGPVVALLKRAVHGTRAEELVGVPVNDPAFDDTGNEDLIDNLPPEPQNGPQNIDACLTATQISQAPCSPAPGPMSTR